MHAGVVGHQATLYLMHAGVAGHQATLYLICWSCRTSSNFILDTRWSCRTSSNFILDSRWSCRISGIKAMSHFDPLCGLTKISLLTCYSYFLRRLFATDHIWTWSNLTSQTFDITSWENKIKVIRKFHQLVSIDRRIQIRCHYIIIG